VEDAGGEGGIGFPCSENFGEVGDGACASAGNDRDADGLADGGAEFAIKTRTRQEFKQAFQEMDVVLSHAQSMLTWRSQHAERTLTGMVVGDGGTGRRPFARGGHRR